MRKIISDFKILKREAHLCITENCVLTFRITYRFSADRCQQDDVYENNGIFL